MKLATKLIVKILYKFLFTLGFCFGSVIVKKQIECESYSEKNCTLYGKCETEIEKCNYDSDKPASCFVLWFSDNTTGKI